MIRDLLQYYLSVLTLLLLATFFGYYCYRLGISAGRGEMTDKYRRSMPIQAGALFSGGVIGMILRGDRTAPAFAAYIFVFAVIVIIPFKLGLYRDAVKGTGNAA